MDMANGLYLLCQHQKLQIEHPLDFDSLSDCGQQVAKSLNSDPYHGLPAIQNIELASV